MMNLLLCSAAVSLSMATFSGELTTNGNFEVGDTSSWQSFPTPNSTFTVTPDSNSGSFAGEVSNTDQAAAAVVKQANLGMGAVSPGDTIQISFAAKGSFAAGGVAFAEFFSEIDGGGTSSAEILGGGPLNLTGSWQTFTFTAVAGPDVSGGVTLQFAAVTGANIGSSAVLLIDDASVSITGVGASYCDPAIPNSTGQPAVTCVTGSQTAASNDIRLLASSLPANQFGYFLAGQTQGMFMPPGSQGIICLSGNIGRFNAQSQIIQGPTGSLQVDLTSIPVNPPTAVQPGDTWNFQCWYRDSNPGTTSNFTNAVSVVFQ
ncbi:MAG: hypothetical protein GY711_24880 [bacterium]|nr:hypothetical protein [bacterium]